VGMERRFLWGGNDENKKIVLVNWKEVCMSNEFAIGWSWY